MIRSRIGAFVIKEIKEALPAVVFFAVSFNIVVLTTQLILDDYLVHVANFAVATTAALVVGKAVLVANALPFLRRYDTAPLIQPVLFKTLVYFLVVFLVRLLEEIVEYWAGGGTVSGVSSYLATHFTWHRFAAVQIWIFVLFFIYAATSELNALFGDGELLKVFFVRRSSEMKLTRRQRIRALVKLDRLLRAHALDEFRDPNAAAYAEMVGLIGGLALRRDSARGPVTAQVPAVE